MNSDEFCKYGSQMIDIVAKYWKSLRTRTPVPDVQPGFMRQLVPQDPPAAPESWENIFQDIDKVVINGNTHWQHPNFFAYFPTACSYQAIMADILSGGLASIGFSWKSSPSMTELEISMMDWLAKALALPSEFLNSSTESGLGIIQNTASDATYIALLAARARAVEYIKSNENSTEQKQQVVLNEEGSNLDLGELCEYPYHDATIISKLIAYCSDQAHSSVSKGAMLAAVRLRKLKSVKNDCNGNFSVTAKMLEAAIKVDRANGLIPFIFIMTLGTTSTCGVDPIDELASICRRENIWVHVDSAYADRMLHLSGAFLLLPEYRYLTRGFEYIDSFNMNTHKALQMNFDCSPMWFRNGKKYLKYFEVDPVYLKHDQTSATDYRHLQIALGRRFRSLKIWFVLRNIGITGLQQHLRKMIDLAQHFEFLIQNDPLLELFVPRAWGLVCFRMKNSTNEMNEELNSKINLDRRIHIVASSVHGVYFLRFVACSTLTNHDDVRQAYQIIHNYAEEIRKS
ncbi:unnamed protein product [Thelazia callipaeda]|uniref:Aromatic-L-amino-acid decarboxylase n=1 Tax=Thelazia callipaeda TaxID=103827 RepID=A0A0N5CMI2_THECL|nr:unnamed protein product [Thelazia callipaeda]